MSGVVDKGLFMETYTYVCICGQTLVSFWVQATLGKHTHLRFDRDYGVQLSWQVSFYP